MSIYFEEANNRWRGEYRYKDIQGKVRVKKFTSKKRVVVKTKMDEFRKAIELQNGTFSPDKTTFQEFADSWLENTQRYKLKQGSYNRKVCTLTNQVYPHIGHFPIGSLTHNIVQQMITKLSDSGLSYSTIKKAYEAVNGCMTAYRIQTGSNLNPCEGIVLPSNSKRENSEISVLNSTQRDMFVKSALSEHSNGVRKFRTGNALVLLLYTGMRLGELIALTWDDVNLENKTITINKNTVYIKTKNGYTMTTQNSTKTKSGMRTIPLTQKAVDMLTDMKEKFIGAEYVVESINHTQITPQNLNRSFHRIMNSCAELRNIKGGVHMLRHTFASMLFENGCPVKTVSEILGHSSAKITEDIYIHILQEQKIKAIESIDKYSA